MSDTQNNDTSQSGGTQKQKKKSRTSRFGDWLKLQFDGDDGSIFWLFKKLAEYVVLAADAISERLSAASAMSQVRQERRESDADDATEHMNERAAN